MIFKQWEFDRIPRHQVQSINSADPTSLLLSPEPVITLDNDINKGYEKAIALPSSLTWLLPADLIHFKQISCLTAVLKQSSNPDPVEIEDVNTSGFYEVDVKPSTKEVRASYPIYELDDHTLVVLIKEDELQHPPILHNFLAIALAKVLRTAIQKVYLLINSDKIIGFKSLSELQPPEFIAGALAAIVTALNSQSSSKEFQHEIMVVQSEGPRGYEIHNITVVDLLVEYMKSTLGYSEEYVTSAYRRWKSNSASQFQSGLYL
ncbi:Pba1p Ecym_4720 [Eremothecium cymbalariae DBVPG|uniref:Proteasome assembly chaperone 1 n=1 Tax=Eremothecium cymbalariae (strain CBS 270.75 / DBVPG 7215 / KCTC 17166 / NRRL Y-17582) TaxID=931890 RepID=G8JSL8_ERECY|nr:hypothetical protein Ecym_4720 [Eremothecium cymbalariae DBVPG\